MAQVHFTQALRRFFPGLKAVDVESKTVGELLEAVDRKYPGLRAYLVDDQGGLRPHVNVFVNDELVKDRKMLSDALRNDSEVYIMQALSGG
jgi:molybdopterin converting factor small subunit